jgi:DNA-binding PadR family transcriptional regulator
MDIKTVILGFLMHRKMTGYDLKQAISISFSFFSNISYGSIYPALKKLNQDQLVSMEVIAGDNERTRKVYSITAMGRAHFLEALGAPIEYGKGRSTFLPRLFFFAHLSARQREALTQGYENSITTVKEVLAQTLPEIETKADPFQRLCALFGVRMLEDLVANVRATLAELTHIENKTNS